MPYILYKEKEIYYEVTGEGRPLVILNGIMMSTASWAIFKEEIGRKNQLILLDFLDQGKSGKMEGEEYTQEIQVEVVKAVIDFLGLQKVSMAGISYGGEVALLFAVKYGERLEKLVVSNTTGKTNTWLKEIGEGWNLSAGNPRDYYSTTIPVIYSPEFYNKKKEWMEKRKEVLINGAFSNEVFMNAMIRLTNSSNDYDVLKDLQEVTVPTLIISSEQDYLTPIGEQKLLHELIPNSELVVLPNAGHAAMYEKPVLFVALLLGFVNLEQVEFRV